MAGVIIKSPEACSFPIDCLILDQGPDIRVKDVQLGPIVISAQDCAREPEIVRPVPQSKIVLTNEDITLSVSVVEVSTTGPIVNFLASKKS